MKIKLSKIMFLISKEKCVECGEKRSKSKTLLCSTCYEKDRMFFETRFEVINEKELLEPKKLKAFNKSPYYEKRHFIAELIRNGVMI